MRAMAKKEPPTPIELDEETPVVFVFRNGKRIQVSLSVYSGALRIESDRRLSVSPSSARVIFVE